MTKERSLNELCEDIEKQLDLSGPFSHNIIGLILSQIDKRFGTEAANQAIEDLGLEEMGWEKVQP